jgi:hypothetical protein
LNYLQKNLLDREDANGVPDAPSHFQHTASYFKFGGKDTDGDGIYDKDDACPDVAGLKNSTVVLILMETESKIVLMLVQTYLV